MCCNYKCDRLETLRVCTLLQAFLKNLAGYLHAARCPWWCTAAEYKSPSVPAFTGTLTNCTQADSRRGDVPASRPVSCDWQFVFLQAQRHIML